MKDRIQLIIDKEQLTPSKLADLIGVQRSSISHILSDRNKPSLDFVQRILQRFPEINSDWLLFGTGEMYKVKKSASLFDKENATIIESKSEPEKIEQASPPEKNHENDAVQITEKKTLENSEKELERIIIFYSDKTFSSYLPND